MRFLLATEVSTSIKHIDKDVCLQQLFGSCMFFVISPPSVVRNKFSMQCRHAVNPISLVSGINRVKTELVQFDCWINALVF